MAKAHLNIILFKNITELYVYSIFSKIKIIKLLILKHFLLVLKSKKSNFAEIFNLLKHAYETGELKKKTANK